jgi:dihydrolipoamide dehydrogenase
MSARKPRRSSRSRALNQAGTKVTGVAVKGKKATVTSSPLPGGAGETHRGRCRARCDRPQAQYGWARALDKIGLALNARGQIEPDHDFRTTVPGVWAIGDVIPGPMLAHKAEDEGIAVAENIAGLTGIVNHDVIPGVVYTQPRNRGRRPDRGAGEGAGRDQGRQVPDDGEQPRQGQ